MNATEVRSLLAVPPILLIAVGLAWAAGQGGARSDGVPLFAVCVVLAFAINWAVFVPSVRFRTERYYDLTGSVTYLSLVLVALAPHRGAPDARALLLACLVAIWALRLGSYLFVRISREGADRRFDGVKTSVPRFFLAWTLQGLWVVLTLSCALAAMTSARRTPVGAVEVVGAVVWLVGFSIEVLADRQKRLFRADPANRDRFIESGLWAWSRHPNYVGEIVLWTGIAIIALPALTGWQHVTLLSPVFVYVLLAYVSGVPLLEQRADQRWGNDPRYRAYRDRTPVLFPHLRRRS